MAGERVMRRHISKKGSAARTWLVINEEGQRQLMDAGRQIIMQRTGLTGRDMRILDPMLSYPSTMLLRERAVVINLEQVKAIITAHEILVLNSKDPSVTPFVDDLHALVVGHHNAAHPHPRGGEDGRDKGVRKRASSLKILPFEFVALEACLEAVCSALENETNILEQEAHPALDKLTSKITTLNLERVRHVKSRLVALTSRVQRVRGELENLLDNDGDMAELYLTDKLVQQQIERSGDCTSDGEDFESVAVDDNYPSNKIYGGTAHSVVTNVEEVEMLLGAYFVQIGGTLNKLSTLGEYVDDTEDYINITLDDKQNRILQTGVKIGTASVLLNSFIAVTGVFGMNIHIELYDYAGMPEFLGTIFGCTAVCVFLYMLAMRWFKGKRLIE